MNDVTRRGLFAAAPVFGMSFAGTARAAAKPAVRAAHITDVHITAANDAPTGVAAMFRHMTSQKDRSPEIVLNTGDTVMGVDGNTTGASAEKQIALWKAAAAKCPVPIQSCLGNHDVWDGIGPTDAVPAVKKGFGLMTEALGMPAPYYSFDRGGWHFISLNSLAGWPKYGFLPPDQFDWLAADLAKTPPKTPICVLSHLPILSVTSLVYGDSCKRGNDNVVPGTWQHSDCWAITELFRRHPNVKLCLSGHMHTVDRCEYRGVWYVCGGAVSGSWWAGSEYGFVPCYGALDLFADGTFDYRFVDYGWAARGWKGKQLKV